MFTKSFKNPKIVCAQVTLTKTGLSAVRTFSPLGVKSISTIYEGKVKQTSSPC
jgi:hypothetical protein